MSEARQDAVTFDELTAGLAPPTGRWTALGDWWADDRRIMVRAREQHGQRADELLAYGLERLQGRTLTLVLPPGASEITANRAAFLDADIEVYEEGGAGCVPRPIPPVSKAVDWYGGLGDVTSLADADQFEGPGWLVELIDWLESRRVERIRRSQYWAWHYRGRQILRLQRKGGALQLVAGVDYRDPSERQPPPLAVDVVDGDELDTGMVGRIMSQLDQAIDRRRTGEDRDHREHLLQSAVAMDPSLLGMRELVRELPAWRPSVERTAGRGFIDFVGVDVDERLHVVETKIGPDAMLGLQGLDYYGWAMAHREQVARQAGADPGNHSVQLHFVFACNPKGLMHAAAGATLERLAPDIPWRCHVIDDWNTVDRPKQLLRPHAVPGIRARTLPEDGHCDGDRGQGT